HTFSKKRAGCIHSTLMDVDGDGDPDFCGSNQTVFWLECPDKPFDGPWTYRTIDDVIKGTHCLITGDVDRDGKIDLIANSFRTEDQTSVPESITWLKVPKDVKQSSQWIRNVFAAGDAPGGNHYMGFGDVNGDGRPDIACGAKGGPKFPGGEWFAWWEQPEDPTKVWKKHLLAENEVGATNIIPVDLDGDGKVDYVASRGHGAGVLWFKGPDFKKIEIDPDVPRPHCLAMDDIDGDGDPDFATCTSTEEGITVWYENDGKANFTKHVIDKGQGSYDIRLVDLDGDKDLDILIAGHSSRNLVWYENPGR
ncbi:MAG: VCBS repeat-containing protein, partial [Verrucomicrobiota bacterium]